MVVNFIWHFSLLLPFPHLISSLSASINPGKRKNRKIFQTSRRRCLFVRASTNLPRTANLEAQYGTALASPKMPQNEDIATIWPRFISTIRGKNASNAYPAESYKYLHISSVFEILLREMTWNAPPCGVRVRHLTQKWANTFTWKIFSINCGEWSFKGLHGKIPALFTRIVTSPTSCLTLSAVAKTCSRFDTSTLWLSLIHISEPTRPY